MDVNDVKACRLCLISDVRMFIIDSSSEHCLKTFLGQNISYTSGLPRYTCYECTALLSKIKKFRSKCLIAQTVLYSIIKLQNVITEKHIKNIDRKKINLQSTLSTHPGNVISNDTPLIEYSNNRQLGDSDDDNKDEDVLNETNCGSDIDVKEKHMEFEHVYTNDTCSDDDDNDNLLMLIVDNNMDQLQEQKKQYVTKSGRIVKSVRKGLNCTIEKVKNKKPLVKGNKKKLQAARKNKKLLVTQINKKFNTSKDYEIKEQEYLEKDFIVTLLSLEEQKAEIKKRMESDNYRNAEFKCEVCYKDFPDENKLKGHMSYHNPEFGDFECEVCRLRFLTAAVLAQHAAAHRTHYQCRRCAYTTTRLELAKNHVEWHDGVKSHYKCDLCGQYFRTLYTRSVHLRLKHSSKVQTKPIKRQRSSSETTSDSSETDEEDLCKTNKSSKRYENTSPEHGGKKHTRKKYSEEALTLACEAVRAGMRRATAVRAYGVPRSTLWDYFKDPSRSFKKPGPTTILTGEEEDRLAQWVVSERANKKRLKNKVREILKGDERLGKFSASETWIRKFINRHPETRAMLSRVKKF